MLERSSKDHQYVLGHVALARSKGYLKLQSVQRIPAVPKDERNTIFHEYFSQTDSGDTMYQRHTLGLWERLLGSRPVRSGKEHLERDHRA